MVVVGLSSSNGTAGTCICHVSPSAIWGDRARRPARNRCRKNCMPLVPSAIVRTDHRQGLSQMLHKSSLSRISLGRMLLLAFLVIAGLPTATGILGWVELQKVARNQTKAINETIPAISEVRGFTEESSRIVAVAPELAAVTTEGARRERAAYLYAQVDALSERVSRYERTA